MVYGRASQVILHTKFSTKYTGCGDRMTVRVYACTAPGGLRYDFIAEDRIQNIHVQRRQGALICFRNGSATLLPFPT